MPSCPAPGFRIMIGTFNPVSHLSNLHACIRPSPLLHPSSNPDIFQPSSSLIELCHPIYLMRAVNSRSSARRPLQNGVWGPTRLGSCNVNRHGPISNGPFRGVDPLLTRDGNTRVELSPRSVISAGIATRVEYSAFNNWLEGYVYLCVHFSFCDCLWSASSVVSDSQDFVLVLTILCLISSIFLLPRVHSSFHVAVGGSMNSLLTSPRGTYRYTSLVRMNAETGRGRL